MSTFKLSDIQAAADKKYGHTDIEVGEETVRLLNALQLPKEKRKALASLDEEKDQEGAEEKDQLEAFQDMIRIVAASEKQADVLLDAIGDNLAHLVQVFETYNKGTELGEA